MVIYIAKTYKELQKKKKPFVYLIINMAIADILDARVATILSVSFSFLGSRWFSGLFGKISLKLAYFSIVFFHWTFDLHADDHVLCYSFN